ILAPLLSGATVVLRPAEIWSGHDFWSQVIKQQLTVVNLPPAYWNQVMQEGAALESAEQGARAADIDQLSPQQQEAQPQRSLFSRAHVANSISEVRIWRAVT